MPDGYNAWGALVYDITTNATYTGSITVCFTYYPASFADPSTLQLFHDGGSGWENVSTSNTYEGETGILCGVTSSLSPFMVVGKTPTSSLTVVAEDWYGDPVGNAEVLVYKDYCGSTEVTPVTTDENGTALLTEVQLGSYCATDATGVPQGYVYVQTGQPNELLVIVGEKPAEGFIVLVLQDENGVPLSAEQLTSNACVHASSEDGGSSGCDSGDGAIDGRIRFGGMPRTVWQVFDYRAPYGYQAIDMPAEISGFVPGETQEIGVRHTTFASPSVSLIVNVVDAQGNPLPGACFTVTSLEYASGCDKFDGSNDGRVFIYGPFAPGDYEIKSYVGFRSGGLSGTVTQIVTIPDGTTIAYAMVTMPPSLVVTSTVGSEALLNTCFRVSGANDYQEDVCDWRDGSDGSVTLYGLPEGDYVVALLDAPPFGYQTTFDDQLVSVGSGALAQMNVEFTPRTDVVLTVTVTDQNGAPLADVCPIAQELSTYSTSTACTDANGVAVFYDFTGEVTVYLNNPLRGYASADSVTVNLAETQTVTMISRALTQSVVVNIADGSGTPITDTCVNISNSENNYYDCEYWYATSRDGEITFYEVASGTYDVTVYSASGNFESYTTQITVEADAPIGVPVTLSQSATFSTLARITSVDGSGNLLSGACYTLLFPGRGVWYQCDAADGANDGVTTFGSGWEAYFSGEYTLIQSRAPEGAVDADSQTFTVGTERPVSVTVVHSGWAMETGTGAVTVAPSGSTGVALTFENVSVAGTTTVEPITAETVSQLPEPSAEFSLDGAMFFEIHTTATFEGSVAVCLPYNPADFDRPQDLALLHYENGSWTDVTVSNDPVAGVICGSVSSFSPFALVKKAPVLNSAPVVTSISGVPTESIAPGTVVTISAAFTDADAGDTHTATVDWGDGTIDTVAAVGSVSASHAYTANGTYTVSVTVTDSAGANGSNTAAVTVVVPNSAPVVGTITGIPTGSVTPGVAVNVSASFSDADVTDTHTATISWGDGTVETVAAAVGSTGTVSSSHAYVAAGTYTITVTVTDGDGATGTSSGTLNVVKASKTVKPGKNPGSSPPGESSPPPPNPGKSRK